jgi:hypothetical protein
VGYVFVVSVKWQHLPKLWPEYDKSFEGLKKKKHTPLAAT